MKLIFCTTEKCLSRLIRWIFNEPASHFAILFDDKIILHSDLLGVGLRWWVNFRQDHEIVSVLEPLDQTLDNEENHYQEMIVEVEKKPYDFKAFFYFGWCGFKYKFFGIPLPIKNSWGQKGQFLCTGLAQAFGITDKDTEIITPWMMRDLLLKTGNYKEVLWDKR